VVSSADPMEVFVKNPKCESTHIAELSARLGDMKGDIFIPGDPKEVGTAINYSNGLYGVSYEYVPAISARSRVGDPVRVCLISYYVHCPKGDDRGKVYSAVNQRTHEVWTLPNASHICGGA
jgi:hypothetical protein